MRMQNRSVLFLLAVLFVLFGATPLTSKASAQQLEDVVYLKDGSIIRGTIVEQRPGESILVRTKDGNQFRYTMALVDRMTKEAPVSRAVTTISEKSPGVAWLLSFLIVGGGQAYNGQWGKGAVLFGSAVIGYGVMVNGLVSDECTYYDDCGSAGIGALVYVGSWIWSQVDAPITASAINRQRRLAHIDFRPRLQSLSRRRQPNAALMQGQMAQIAAPKWGITVATLRF